MRSILIASAILALAGCANSGTGSIQKPPPQTMQVDLQRYQGTWYELARLPMFFQRNCVQSEAHYGLRDDGRIDVTNRCRDKDGEWIEAKGVAEPQVEGKTDKLWVTFDNWASKLLPIKGDYWVIYHDEDYRVALVGHRRGPAARRRGRGLGVWHRSRCRHRGRLVRVPRARARQSTVGHPHRDRLADLAASGDLAAPRRAAMMRVAHDWLYLRYQSGDEARETGLPRARALLLELSRTEQDSAPSLPGPPTTSPDQGHESQRIRFGLRLHRGDEVRGVLVEARREERGAGREAGDRRSRALRLG